MNNALIQFLQSSILLGTPLLFGSVGEILTEKSGNLNLGIPGIMYVGGISGVVGGFLYQQAAGGKVNAVLAILIPLLSALAGSLLASLIYCFLTVTLRANQNVAGIAASAAATSSAARSSRSLRATHPSSLLRK